MSGPDGTDAAHLVADTRERAARPPAGRERVVSLVDGVSFLTVATLLAVAAPTSRSASLLVVATYVAAYALASRVEFEFAAGSAVPTQLVFVSMLFVLPARLVPLLVAAAFILGNGLDYLRGRLHPERAVGVTATAWYTVGPSLVLALGAEAAPAWRHAPLYVGLLAAQFAIDAVHAMVRERLALGISPRELARPLLWVYAVDALLAPAGLLVAVVAAGDPFAVLLVVPLLVLFALFARERRARLDHALELHGVRASNRELDELARRDELTGAANRRAWEEELPSLVDRARHAGAPLCVALVDLDHFKRYNDTHGHPAGDRLLAEAAQRWRGQLRAGDVLARYGGEEFAVALPHCRGSDALGLLERLRREVPAGQTCSIGLAEWDGHEDHHAIVARADAALYRAKHAGRDRVATCGEFAVATAAA
jgi:diguanylate cyclase (GGDEF)-like protein